MMRKILCAGVISAAAMSAQATSALAFGDTCTRPLEVAGRTMPTMQTARASAISAWETAVRRREGARFADWWYSGDRGFSCTWNTIGNAIVCRASAMPCAPASN